MDASKPVSRTLRQPGEASSMHPYSSGFVSVGEIMKPIQTVYKGYKFRSRLEARWAVFFDALDIEWRYEDEGYQLSNGNWYLPDFWLPTFSGGTFAEVKPIPAPDDDTYDNLPALCKDSGKKVWYCHGVPDFKEYLVYIPTGSSVIPVDINWGIPNFDQAGNDMFWESGYSQKDLEQVSSDYFRKAVYKAKQARFEHGEQG